MTADYLTDDSIRQAIIDRAKQFRALTGMSLTAIGTAALRDGCAIPEIIDGRDFKVSTYRRLMKWFDEHWPREMESPSLAAGNPDKAHG